MNTSRCLNDEFMFDSMSLLHASTPLTLCYEHPENDSGRNAPGIFNSLMFNQVIQYLRIFTFRHFRFNNLRSVV